MQHECEGSGTELTADPPAAEAAACPVCGRATGVEPAEPGAGKNFRIASHQTVVNESR
ncbi:hypothetical protein [Mycolicibacterium hippocampi]|uniref:hypothetical protein n=1 Tax=Mycobacteriaceae TaxID=1762 RepID=UPI0015B4CB79|nr:hypothetical protein [Mycolicibacterium hippocampi]